MLKMVEQGRSDFCTMGLCALEFKKFAVVQVIQV